MLPEDLLYAYHAKVHSQRCKFAEGEGIRAFNYLTDKKALHSFLMFFAAYGVGMTEGVEAWIRRAGEATTQKGFAHLGKKLQQHAAQEAGHHLMMIEDLRWLTNSYNNTYGTSINADELLSMPRPVSVQAYIDLHEDVIVSPTPFAQIAIEYEIERLSVDHGPRMVNNILYTLGKDFEQGATFLIDHVKLDVGHTEFNERQLGKFLAEHPQQLDTLAGVGAKALGCYKVFLQDCLKNSTLVH